MLIPSTSLALLATTPALNLSATVNDKLVPDNNFHSGNCVFYWVPYLLENTPMHIEVFDAVFDPIFTDNTTLLPSWANHKASVDIYSLDRPITIQSQAHNWPAKFVYGDKTRISIDPKHVKKINTELGSNGDMPNIGECAWPLPNDSIKPNSQNLMKCTFSCGSGY